MIYDGLSLISSQGFIDSKNWVYLQFLDPKLVCSRRSRPHHSWSACAGPPSPRSKEPGLSTLRSNMPGKSDKFEDGAD